VLTLCAVLFLAKVDLIGQCSSNNNSGGACNANGGALIGTITPITTWQSAAFNANRGYFEFNVTSTSNIYRFVSCSGQDIEFTIYSWDGTSTGNLKNYDSDNDLPDFTACSPGTSDEYAIYIPIATGIHRVRISRHGGTVQITHQLGPCIFVMSQHHAIAFQLMAITTMQLTL
jgi:hypothetical protein